MLLLLLPAELPFVQFVEVNILCLERDEVRFLASNNTQCERPRNTVVGHAMLFRPIPNAERKFSVYMGTVHLSKRSEWNCKTEKTPAIDGSERRFM